MARATAPGRAAALPASGIVLGRAWPELTAAVGLLVAWVAMAGIPVGNDIVWQLWIARQLLGGTHLYSQIVEVNPPLWYWMAMPVQWAAEVSGIAATRLMVDGVFVWICVSTCLLALLLRDKAPRDRAVLLLAMLALTVLTPLAPFGQREHECLIAAIPYLALVARRAEDRPVPWPLALAIGLLAAPAFALKHYFVLAPLALEAWLWWVRRGGWRPIRPETVALAAAAVLYAAAVLVLTPDYMTAVVPMLTAAYGEYGNLITTFVREPYVWIWAASAIVLVFYRHRGTPLTGAAAVAALAFGLGFVLQHKWWDYHALPLAGTLAFAVATLATGRAAWSRAGWLGSVGALATAALAVMVGLMQGPYVNDLEPYVDRLLADVPPGTSVMIVTPFGTRTWPMLDADGFAWPSRYFGLWQWPAISAAEKAGGVLPDGMARLAETVRRDTIEDLECNPPEVMLVDELPVVSGGRALDFLNEDPEFRMIFGNYLRIGSASIFTAYRRVAPLLPPADPTACRTIYQAGKVP